MTALGIMAYPDLSPMEQIRDYMKLASSYGCSRVVSSMLSAEGTKQKVVDYFRRFIDQAHEYGLTVSLDVNTGFLKKLDQSYDDISLFHDIGCDTIRLDGSYGAEHDLVMIHNPYGIRIEMNASSKRVEEELAYFKEHGVAPGQIQLCHNAYPQRYTGLKWKDFLEKNERLKSYGHRIAAFLSSNVRPSVSLWGADDGLPTVERLRDLPIDLQMRILLATDMVDDVVIGNCFASEAEFESLAEMLKPQKPMEDSPVYAFIRAYGPVEPEFGPCRRLKVILDEEITPAEKKNLLELVPQMDNGDSSEWIWRSRCGRHVNKDCPIPPRETEGDFFPAGTVVIVNDRYPHYSGELQIVRQPIINDGKRNRIARLAPGEELMLELIQANDVVEFYEYKTTSDI